MKSKSRACQRFTEFCFMWLSITKDPESQLLLSAGNMAFSLYVDFNTMWQTAWLLLRMVNTTKLPKLHISLLIFTRLKKKLPGKACQLLGFFVLDSIGHICGQYMNMINFSVFFDISWILYLQIINTIQYMCTAKNIFFFVFFLHLIDFVILY